MARIWFDIGQGKKVNTLILSYKAILFGKIGQGVTVDQVKLNLCRSYLKGLRLSRISYDI